jgi:hypothetical protein
VLFCTLGIVVFRSSGLEIIRTPFRAPQANGVAERLVHEYVLAASSDLRTPHV